MDSIVTSQLTNGFGNNIFQYVAGRQLAEFHEAYYYVVPPNEGYYAIEDLKSLGINFVPVKTNAAVQINDRNYKMAFDQLLNGKNLFLNGYFEDYTHYIDNLENIRSWFEPVEARKDNALVVHMRTGDRLFMKNEFYTKPRAENYLRAIEKFDFDELHIVTDMPKWDYVSAEELSSMKFHLNVPGKERVPIEESVKFFNEFIDGFAQYNPVVKKRSIVDDFNFIRSFKNILFEHGTLSWWAAILSDADKVGVYGPWRPWKGKTNKNLSNIPLDNWFKWE